MSDTSLPQVWTPPRDIAAHNRQELPANLIFFAAPPPEIGKILSAYSTLNTENKRTQFSWYELINGIGEAGMGGIAAGTVVMLLVGWLVKSTPLALMLFVIVGGGVTLYLAKDKIKSGFKRSATCTFIGELGMATATWNEEQNSVIPDVFEFKLASVLHMEATQHFQNGSYTHTDYGYVWQDDKNSLIYVFGGKHHDRDGNPEIDDRYHFAKAGEMSWNAFSFNRVEQELAHHGSVKFPIDSDKSIIVGNGWVEFIANGQKNRIQTSELDRLSLDRGTFRLRRKDARNGLFGIGSSGVFEFPYAALANAQLFLMVFDSLVGVDSH
jgi:hypothetical protein